MPPTVSVVIPTFNRSTLLLAAIESVFAQTYTDYELIVIDDGSTDDTREKLLPYMDRIKYLYQTNRGASAAQNKGIEVAKGEWVSILASDDLWLPEKLERQIKALSALGSEFGACFTDCIPVGDHNRTLSEFEEVGMDTRLEFGPIDDPIKYILAARYLPLRVQSLLVKRSVLEEIEWFDEAMVVEEDVDLVFRLSFKTRFCFVSAALVEMDLTPTRPHLSQVYVRGNDRAYASTERRYQKWLALPDVQDPRIRRTIQGELREVYYGWAISKLYERDFSGVLQKINQIKPLGDGYHVILATLLARAAAKMSRTLRGRAKKN
jgi:glycosyltransferase involved in cell wall biosynthesis